MSELKQRMTLADYMLYLAYYQEQYDDSSTEKLPTRPEDLMKGF